MPLSYTSTGNAEPGTRSASRRARSSPGHGVTVGNGCVMWPRPHERRAQCGMTGERQLDRRREDADAISGFDVHRLAEPDLARQRLHEVLGHGAVDEDGELVAGERCVGEDVGDDVLVRG